MIVFPFAQLQTAGHGIVWGSEPVLLGTHLGVKKERAPTWGEEEVEVEQGTLWSCLSRMW